MRQPGEQFRLAADFEAKIIRLARVQDFLHHLAQLVHLDGKHAAKLSLIIELRDGTLERLVQRLDAVAQNVLEPDEQRKLQPARLRLLDHIGQIHRHARVLQRPRHDVSGVVDVVILRAPAMDVVKRARRLDVPRRRRVLCIAHLMNLNRANYKTMRAESNKRNEIFWNAAGCHGCSLHGGVQIWWVGSRCDPTRLAARGAPPSKLGHCTPSAA